MRIPELVRRYLVKRYVLPAILGVPDVDIGPGYMDRWWLRYPHVKDKEDRDRLGLRIAAYLHRIKKSDDNRALHDHPWWNISILLVGNYIEHVPVDPSNPAGPSKSIVRAQGSVVIRSGKMAHRLEVGASPVWSLFIIGPRVREWGFHCPNGWKSWKEFTGYARSGDIKDAYKAGPGCDS